jgi:hypothetical protein
MTNKFARRAAATETRGMPQISKGFCGAACGQKAFGAGALLSYSPRPFQNLERAADAGL